MTEITGYPIVAVGEGGAFVSDDGNPSVFFDFEFADGTKHRFTVRHDLFSRVLFQILNIGGRAFRELGKQGMVEGGGEAITDPLPVEKYGVAHAPGLVVPRLQLKGGIPVYLSLNSESVPRFIELLSAALEESKKPPKPTN